MRLRHFRLARQRLHLLTAGTVVSMALR